MKDYKLSPEKQVEQVVATMALSGMDINDEQKKKKTNNMNEKISQR